MDAKTRQDGHKAADSDRYKDLINSIDDWVWELDKNGLYTFSSPQV